MWDIAPSCQAAVQDPARVGPTHRLQRLPQALLRPGQVPAYYTSIAAERLSPSARERVLRLIGSSRQDLLVDDPRQEGGYSHPASREMDGEGPEAGKI
jgi:hypothetical protein